MLTMLKELSLIVDKIIMHRVDQILNEDNDWFDELINKKIKEQMEKNDLNP